MLRNVRFKKKKRRNALSTQFSSLKIKNSNNRNRSIRNKILEIKSSLISTTTTTTFSPLHQSRHQDFRCRIGRRGEEVFHFISISESSFSPLFLHFALRFAFLFFFSIHRVCQVLPPPSTAPVSV